MARTFARGSEARIVALTALEGHPLPVPATIHELLEGDNALLVELHAPAGYDAPAHAHDHESLVYILAGRVRATVGDEVCELGVGDAVRHAAGVPHHVEALTDARWIEVKAPPVATWS